MAHIKVIIVRSPVLNDLELHQHDVDMALRDVGTDWDVVSAITNQTEMKNGDFSLVTTIALSRPTLASSLKSS